MPYAESANIAYHFFTCYERTFGERSRTAETTWQVFHNLLTLMNERGFVQASQNTISKSLHHMTRETVCRHIPLLEKMGLLQVLRTPVNSKIPHGYELAQWFWERFSEEASVSEEQTSVSKESIIDSRDSSYIEESLLWRDVLTKTRVDAVRSHLLAEIEQNNLITSHLTKQMLVARFGAYRVWASLKYTRYQENIENPIAFVTAACSGQCAIDWGEMWLAFKTKYLTYMERREILSRALDTWDDQEQAEYVREQLQLPRC